MNIIEDTRINIIENNNTAQKQFEELIIHLDPERTTSINVSESLHGNLDFSVLDKSNFKNIKSITLAQGEITNISNLPTTLEILNCNNQYLVNLENLPPSLTELHCEHNYIDYIDFSTVPKLRVLNINNNKFTKLENLPYSLEELYCDNNSISLLDLKNVEKLRVLHSSNNKTMIIQSMPPSVVDFVSENNPFLEINAAKTEESQYDGEQDGGRNSASIEKVNFIVGLNDYFKLKNQYETKKYEAQKKAFNTSTIKKRGRKLAQQVIPKCINCKRPVGTIFSNKDRNYSAVCGDKLNPCNLKIQIYAGIYYRYKENIDDFKNYVQESKEDIIKLKLDTMFNYISNKESSSKFKHLMEEFNALDKNYTRLLDQNKIIFYDDEQRKEAINKKRAVIFGLLDSIKKLVLEYEQTENQVFLNNAMHIYVKELLPEMNNLRLLKNEINEVNYVKSKETTEDASENITLYNSVLSQIYVKLQKIEEVMETNEPKVMKYNTNM